MASGKPAASDRMQTPDEVTRQARRGRTCSLTKMFPTLNAMYDRDFSSMNPLRVSF